MIIYFYKNWICPLDETVANPIFGRVDEEDSEAGIYLVANYDLSKNFLGYIILSLEDLSTYRIFKGRDEFQEYVLAHFTP